MTVRTFSHRLIDVLSHRLYRYHRGGGGGGSSEFSSSLSFGFKYPVSAMHVLLLTFISAAIRGQAVVVFSYFYFNGLL